MANKMQSGAKSCAVSFNVVPLVDVIMLLIFFFVLTTEIASKSIASMDLPQPTNSVAKEPKKTPGGGASETGNKIIINVVSRAQTGESQRQGANAKLATEGHLMIDGDDIDIIDSDAIVRRINQRRTAAAQNPDWKKEDFTVEVRADKDVYWQYVAPVMAAASSCGIKNVTLTALVDSGSAAKPEGAI
jgi:biopolymer transport protein ExbD